MKGMVKRRAFVISIGSIASLPDGLPWGIDRDAGEIPSDLHRSTWIVRHPLARGRPASPSSVSVSFRGRIPKDERSTVAWTGPFDQAGRWTTLWLRGQSGM